MKWNRLFAYLIGCVAFGLSFLAYTEYIYLLGFPDGFITELEYIQRGLAYLLIAVSVIAGSYCIYLGRIASQKAIGRKLTAAIALYLIFVIGISLIDYYYRLRLMNNAIG